MIKAIIFDVDGVLLDSFESNFVFYQNLMRASGYEPPTREEYRAVFHKTFRDAVRELTKLTDETKIDAVSGLIDSIDAPPQKLMPGATDVVVQLKKKYHLAIVTSRPRAYAHEPPLDTLKHHFDAAIADEDTVKHKPDPEPLLLAAQKLGVQPGECVYVGDAENDMKAAHAAGMKFIFFSREALDGADACTSDSAHLPEAIKSLDNVGYCSINKKVYDVLASEYDGKATQRKSFNEGIVDRFIPFVHTGKEILDIGCAVGLDMEILRSRGFLVTGIDISSEMVNRAKARNPGCSIVEGNFMNVGFSIQFDGIWAQSFIHLFPKSDAAAVLEKIKSLLKPGGVVHLTTSKEVESTEGYVEKHDYTNKVKRFRKYWTYEELRDFVLGRGFIIKDYYEVDDPNPAKNKRWMVFIIEK